MAGHQKREVSTRVGYFQRTMSALLVIPLRFARRASDERCFGKQAVPTDCHSVAAVRYTLTMLVVVIFLILPGMNHARLGPVVSGHGSDLSHW